MKRILSLDGGGIRGALTTCFLVELEKQLGKPCREIFDFVAGTSTGALIAAAIAAGLPATRILEIYTLRAKEIFNHAPDIADVEAVGRGYMFDSDNIRKVLVSEFGEAANWLLNDSPIKIMLTAKGVNLHPWYFVPDHPKNSGETGTCSMVQCACASAAAPIYFSPVYVNPGKVEVGWCFDGGAGIACNPVYRACVEAFECDDRFDPKDTLVTSLGTGFTVDTQANPPAGALATIGWAVTSLVDASVDEQTETAMRQWPGIVQRFNWALPSNIDEADVSAIPGLVALGQQLAPAMNWAQTLQL
jgi:uncharacterized protein